jgi:hypothetical protein
MLFTIYFRVGGHKNGQILSLTTKTRQIDIFRKVIRGMQILPYFPSRIRTHTHTHTHTPVLWLAPRATYNANCISWKTSFHYFKPRRMFENFGGARSVQTDSPSPLLAWNTFQHPNNIEPRGIPTRAATNGFADTNSDRITIRIGTLNIRDARNSNLEAALRASEQMKVDVTVLTETRLHNDCYTRSAFGYTVFAMTTTYLNQGGVALVHRSSNRWQVESEMRHGPNVISFHQGAKKCESYIIP